MADRLAHSVAFVVAVVAPACGGGGWVQDHPDLAAQARDNPGSFVQPAYDQWNEVTTLGANYTMRVTKGIVGRTFDLYISVQRPGNIDILVQAPTGLTEAYLRADEREVGLFVLEDMVLYSGPATRDTFARALGFGLSAADAVAVLLGYGVEHAGLPTGLPAWDDEARRVRVDHGSSVSVWLHPLTLRFDRVEHRAGADRVIAQVLEWVDVSPEQSAVPAPAGPGLEVEDLDADAGTPVPVPSAVTLEVEPEGHSFRLRMVGPATMNRAYPADYFELQRPPGVRELPLSELARDGGLFQRGSDE